MTDLKAALALLVLTSGLALPGHAAMRIPLDIDSDASEWKHVTLPNTPAVRFSSNKDGSLTADAMGGFGMVYCVLRDIEGFPQLSWRWRVDKASPATDARLKGGDDRPLALHVWFPLPQSAKGFWNSVGNGIAEILGAPPAGRVITYMWGGKHRAGESFKNPHLLDHGRIVVQRGPTAKLNAWVTEKIDYRADYQRLFGEIAPLPNYIAISADSDDTGGMSRASISDIVFTTHDTH